MSTLVTVALVLLAIAIGAWVAFALAVAVLGVFIDFWDTVLFNGNSEETFASYFWKTLTFRKS